MEDVFVIQTKILRRNFFLRGKSQKLQNSNKLPYGESKLSRITNIDKKFEKICYLWSFSRNEYLNLVSKYFFCKEKSVKISFYQNQN